MNSCVLHHELSEGIYGLPGWGNEETARGWQGWVLCCAASPDDSCARSSNQALRAGRSNLWFEIGDGMTDYDSGRSFCSSQGQMLCCYDDYCPDGPGQAPLGGRRGGDEWAPTRDDANYWVQVGTWGGDPANSCVLHHELSGGIYGLPGWGNSGSSARHQGWIMCCPTTTRTDLWSSGGDTDPVCSRSPILGPKPPPPPPSNTGNPGDPIAINFQPPTMAVPEGYIKDSGALFGDRGNGYRYGWSCDLEALGDYRDRDGASTRASAPGWRACGPAARLLQAAPAP